MYNFNLVNILYNIFARFLLLTYTYIKIYFCIFMVHVEMYCNYILSLINNIHMYKNIFFVFFMVLVEMYCNKYILSLIKL